MMKEHLRYLQQIKVRFEPFIKNPHLMYTYIAPVDNGAYSQFYSLAENQPTLSASMFEVLSNSQLIEKLLLDNFGDEELTIYIASNDTYSIMLNGTLKEYIEREKITFDF